MTDHSGEVKNIKNSKIIEVVEAVGWSQNVAAKTGKRTSGKPLSLSQPDSIYLPHTVW